MSGTPGPRQRRPGRASFGRRLALALVAACLPLALAAADPAGEHEAQDSATQLDQLRAKIRELRAALSGARDQQHRLRDELRATELEIGKLSRTLAGLDDQLRQKRGELDALRARRDRAQGELEAQRRALAQQVVAGYIMGRQGYVKILLNQQDPAAIGRALTYYDYLNRARAERIGDVDRKLEEIRALEQDISGETEALERLRTERAQQVGALERSRSDRRRILAKLDTEIRGKQSRLEVMLQDEKRLADLVARLREALSAKAPPAGDAAPFSSLKGRLSWPAAGKLAARFGTRRAEGRLTWRGVMIDAAAGAEVHAVYQGRVVFADWLRGFGLLIIVDHGNGYMSLYGHNQSLYKSAGEWVDKGAVIATVGDSGGLATPGLYFEIRHDGVPDDPIRWCASDP